jgi:3-dehydroquinate synthase
MSVDKHTLSSSLRIRSGQGDYDVQFFDDSKSLATSLSAIKDSFVLVDETVAHLYPGLLSNIDRGRIFAIAATEENKTLSGVERVATFIQQGGASRASTLIVVGGGIIQDIGTFTAHIYFRGIPYVYVPTTLLSMSDSCIGAKCGVNLGSFKNQLGFFQSPSRVALKLAITDGDEAFGWLEQKLNRGGFDIAFSREAIERSLETKRRVIEEDEYERGLRKTLNYGHTFGHALESVTENEVPHGLAVAWGVDIASFVATEIGLLSKDIFARIHVLNGEYFSFGTSHRYSAEQLLQSMKKDKKAASGSVQLILPRAFGHLEIVPTPIDGSLLQLIATYLDRENICSQDV